MTCLLCFALMIIWCGTAVVNLLCYRTGTLNYFLGSDVMWIYRLLADLVVVAHAAYVLFVILGLVLVLVGLFCRWNWIRNFWFRIVHLTMIAVVVFEALWEITCPLTTLEAALRQRAGESAREGSFVGHWMHELLFYEAEPWLFTMAYCLFGSLVVVAFLMAPPRRPFARQTPQS